MELSSDTHDTVEKERRSWFVMRDLSRPNAKLPAYMKLDELGIRCYTPTVWRTMVRNGVRTSRKVPVIHDLLFVREARETLDPVVAKIPTLQYRFLRRTWREPMTVRDEEMERNILSVYTKLYRRYQADKALIPQGNLIEVKFEDYEADAYGMTRHIYDALGLPGFREADDAIRAYTEKKKGYKKNAYKYNDRTVRLVEENWGYALKDWNYSI